MTTMLTEDQVDALWRAAGALPFLAELCERWFDSEGAAREQYDRTIRSYVKCSKLASAVGSKRALAGDAGCRERCARPAARGERGLDVANQSLAVAVPEHLVRRPRP